MPKQKIKRRPAGQSSANFPATMSPLLQRIYAARNITDGNDLEYPLSRLLPCDLLSGITEASELLAKALLDNEKIIVVGDYDADGATSCAVAIRAFRLLGKNDVEYIVPNRFDFGYGLSPKLVELITTDYDVDLIITVDNGIASHQGIALAKERGLKVLVTDHHLPAETLPVADVIVNPNLKDDNFPSKNLAGVGVIFYVMLALRSHLRQLDWYQSQGIKEPVLAGLLDLVALGTVADVVALDYNNRILVAQGIRRIRKGLCCAGITALIKVAAKNQEKIVSSDIGFAIAPRLNAAGRLSDMSKGIECLLSDDPEQAMQLALQLDGLNRQRRVIESDMHEQAFSSVDKLVAARVNTKEEPVKSGLCLYQSDWHQGVIGILASRVKEQMRCPVIIFTDGDEGLLKGSGRTIVGLHLRDVLSDIDSLHPGIIEKYGGHAMAAGLTLYKKYYQVFVDAFIEVTGAIYRKNNIEDVMWSDGELLSADFSVANAGELRNAGPWGQAFSEPLFDGVFAIEERFVVGQKHIKMKLVQQGQEDILLEAIKFNLPLSECPQVGVYFCAAYRLNLSEYNGRSSAQLIIESIEHIENKPS